MRTLAPPLIAPSVLPSSCSLCETESPELTNVKYQGEDYLVCPACIAAASDQAPAVAAPRTGTCPFCHVDYKATTERVLEPHPIEVDGKEFACPGSRCTVPASRCR